MRLKKFFYQQFDLLFILSIGAIAVIITYFKIFEYLRWLTGFLFLFLGSGYSVARLLPFGADILKLCVAVGGVLTGEHGVGVEKRDLMGEMFDATDLACQQRVKCAFDPGLLLNPGKVFPTLHRCAELGRMHVHRGKLAFPELPRF